MTVAHHTRRAEISVRPEVDRMLAKLGAMPRILCWKCRKLTPFELDHCQHCGTPFAGSTGGAYGSARTIAPRNAPIVTEVPAPRARTLSQIVDDIRRVHDIPARPRERPREEEVSVHLYQCPSCGRFVSEEATVCLCGVRFASGAAPAFACPECEAQVPEDEDVCPVCGVQFEAVSLADLLVYSCPRCGARVASDQARCSCGVWFED